MTSVRLSDSTRSTGTKSDARDEALADLANRFAKPLERFFLRRVSVKEDASDLVQEVFLRISRMVDPTAIEQPAHFLFTTASNVLKDRARRDAVRDASLHENMEGKEPAGSDIPADRVLIGREAALRLDAVLRTLPERTRDVFVLRMLEGLKMADVARGLGISTRAAEKHQAKALAIVTAALAEWR